MSFDKITTRIKTLVQHPELPKLDRKIDPAELAQMVIRGIYSGISTSQIDTLAAETAAYMATRHPDWGELASRIAVSNLQKTTEGSFKKLVVTMRNYVNPANGKLSPLYSEELEKIVLKHGDEIEARIKYLRDFKYDYFGFKTLTKSYLLKIDGQIAERPQHMLMRVSLGIHGWDLKSAFATYELMSNLEMTHASPTLFNAGTPRPQCSSCFLLSIVDDSIEGIFETVTRCAKISKLAGGIGLNVHCIRSKGSYIAGTNGTSNGLVPMLKVFNSTARYVDQGGGKRKGAFAIYLELWHADIFDFLDLRKNTGAEEIRCRDLFLALWVSDLFMERVQQGGKWSLMDPDQCPGLYESYGEAHKELYEKYESEGKYVEQIKAQDLWYAIIDAQVETSAPYILFKDACNEKSNQKNLGTIRCSNLCSEIIQYSDKDEVAVCNLASIALSKMVDTTSAEKPFFDHEKLYNVAYQACKNLNRVIDINHYPLVQAQLSNMRHRPMGIGVQGLADALILLRLPFDSEEAKRVNREMMETIYYAALTCSTDLAEKEGPYSTFQGSPASKGILQYDMWGVEPSNRWNWEKLKNRINAYGLRNSLLVALMPTASTSQILGNLECFEPLTSNVFKRTTLAGEFPLINKYLVDDLIKLGMWTEPIRAAIIEADGSIQSIAGIPDEIKTLYRTVWEISQKSLMDMAADRAAFIDQSQSFNVYMSEPSTAKITSAHFYAWKKGLKTGLYYFRQRVAVDPQKDLGVDLSVSVDMPSETVVETKTKKFVYKEPEKSCKDGSCGA